MIRNMKNFNLKINKYETVEKIKYYKPTMARKEYILTYII